MAKAKKNREVTAVDVLRYARALLARRGGWTQEVLARNSQGCEVPMLSSDACSFCSSGAIHRAAHDLDVEFVAENIWITLKESIPAFKHNPNYHLVVDFNDKARTKQSVIALFDKAIAKLEAMNA